MQFGLHIGPQNTSVAELRKLWRWADGAGIDWISLWDHLYEAPPAHGDIDHFEAFSMLGALAADTTNARLGCLVFCSQYRNVGVLMKGAVSVDHLSNGRFEIGMGSGWHEPEARAFGINFPSQGERFKWLESQLQAITAWRRGEHVTQSTTGVELQNAKMNPAPMGKFPIWIGGVGRQKTLRMVAQYADGWNAAYVDAAEYAELNLVLDDWCEKVGRDPRSIERSINLVYSLSSEDPVQARANIEKQWGANAARVMGGMLIGRPQDAIEQVAAFKKAGAQLVNVAIRPPWDHDVLVEYVENAIPKMRQQLS